ncbi:glycosyltransferase, partial [Oscillatoria amoena NRMC-F 0135]|nr:glycosyltransferase [Oscillatoria amoena NRMC-F 0135]
AEYGTTGAWLIPVCRAARASLTVHFHGFDAFEKQTLKDYEAAYREVFDSRARIVVVSREMERQLINLGARAEQVFWNPYGVNLEQFRAVDAGKNDPCFVAVGRFVEKKAPYLTLLAFAQAAQEVPEARLEMVGDGPLRSVCEQMEQAMRSAGQLREGQVRFLGPRNTGEIAGLLRQARAFVQHSIRASSGDAEGTPVAILEAAATGLPVISTRHMGIQEAVVEGQTGWLGDELDVTAMAKAMIEAAQQPEEAARRGQQGREHIARNYNQAAQIEKLRQIAMEAPVP